MHGSIMENQYIPSFNGIAIIGEYQSPKISSLQMLLIDDKGVLINYSLHCYFKKKKNYPLLLEAFLEYLHGK